jgi:O-antigen/teichoic acid export membrane protein
MTSIDPTATPDLNAPSELPPVPSPASAHRSIAYLAGALAGGNILASVFSQIGGILAARFAGVAAWGLFQTIGIVQGYARFVQLGIGNGLNRELPYFIGKGDHQRVKELAAAAQAWILVVSLASGTCMLLFAGWQLLQGDPWRAAGWGTYAILMFTLFYGQFYLQVTFRTGHDFARLAMANVVQSGLALLLVGLVALWSFYGLCLRVIVSGLASVAVLYYWRPVRVGPKWNFSHLKHLFVIGAPIFGVGELYSFWGSYLSRTLVWAYLGDGSVGLYSLVLQAAAALDIIPMAVSQVIYPRMAEKYGRTGKIQGLLGMTVKPIAATALGMIPAIALAWWLVEPAMRLILPAFTTAIPAMRWGILIPFLSSFASANVVFNVARRQDLYVMAIIGGMLSYGGSLLWLIRDGATLVAFPQAMLVGQVVFIVLSYLLIFHLVRKEHTTT